MSCQTNQSQEEGSCERDSDFHISLVCGARVEANCRELRRLALRKKNRLVPLPPVKYIKKCCDILDVGNEVCLGLKARTAAADWLD